MLYNPDRNIKEPNCIPCNIAVHLIHTRAVNGNTTHSHKAIRIIESDTSLIKFTRTIHRIYSVGQDMCTLTFNRNYCFLTARAVLHLQISTAWNFKLSFQLQNAKTIEALPCLIQTPHHFQSTNIAHMSLEVLDLDFVKPPK